MSVFKKKSDPITARSKELNEQIVALEAQIKQLSTKIEHTASHPRVRSTAVPQGPTVEMPPAAPPRDPIFERVEPAKTGDTAEIESTAGHYNELGIRKYDLLGMFRRVQGHLRGPSTTNPKLVSYLAAGSIKGLRPLRYEKRVARNRFIVLSIVLVGFLWGILALILNHR
jgi:hypothetical protein